MSAESKKPYIASEFLILEALDPTPENEALLSREHPRDWVNPVPKGVYDLVVIGGGPAGLISALTAAREGKRVALIEKDLIGGECLNIGCIPSKSLIRTSRLYADMRDAQMYGAQIPGTIKYDFALTMKRMRRVRAQISRHFSVDQLIKKKIDVFFGHARFASDHTIAIDHGPMLHFKKVVIATGTRPRIPDIPGIDGVDYLTNDTVFNLEACPESLLVIGGGATGCELAQTFARLGSKVTIVQVDPMFLDNIERDGAQLLSDALARDGIDIHLNSEVLSIARDGDKKIIEIVNTGYHTRIEVTHVLIGVGQVPNTAGLDLEKAHVKVGDDGSVVIDQYMRSTNRDIFAVGNVSGEDKYVHIPDALARTAALNALTGSHQTVNALSVPWCIYTDPEIAHVGMQVKEARQQNIPVKTFTILMHQVDRAIADSEDIGFVKIHLREGTDTILGATVVSRHAGDIITSISLAIQSKIGLEHFAEINYPYPTQGDAIRSLALAYRRSSKPTFWRRCRHIWRRFSLRRGHGI